MKKIDLESLTIRIMNLVDFSKEMVMMLEIYMDTSSDHINPCSRMRVRGN